MDTDTISLLLRPNEQTEAIRSRVQAIPPDDLSVSVITVGELMEGTLSLIRKQQVRNEEMFGYDQLEQSVRFLYRFAILSYDQKARDLYLAFPPAIKRLGRGDCQIAAIALSHNAVVVTRNLRHFEQIPGVVCEDWGI